MRITVPTRQLHVAAAICRLHPVDQEFGIECDVSDAVVCQITGYSRRSVQLALQELEQDGAIAVGRAVDGWRLVTPQADHQIWSFARTLIEVA